MDLLIIVTLIVANGMLAMSELAVVSSNRARLRRSANAGDAGALAALDLAERPSVFLSTVQIGITAVGIFSGAFGEATLARSLSAWVAGWPAFAPYSDAIALAIVVTGITYLSLIVGELVPKQIALHDPERVARLVARPMRWLSLAAYPLVQLLSVSSQAVLRLLGSKPGREATVSEEEIRAMLMEGARLGVLEKSEHELVKNVFRLDDRPASVLMTPRADLVYLDVEEPPGKHRETIIASPHSYYPVCAGGLEQVLGVVRTRDLLARQLRGEALDLGAALQEPLLVPQWRSGIDVLEQLKRSRSHFCLVVDELGAVQGALTLHDILEAIVGEIGPSAEPQWVRRDDGSWLVDGMVFADDVKEKLGLRRLPGEGEEDYDTLGGMVMTRMGRVPGVGEHFDWEGHRFEVVDMDGKRVDRVLITPPAAAAEDAADDPGDEPR
ncbi:MAG: hemolysin family protein [Pseudomonadota bacterium]